MASDQELVQATACAIIDRLNSGDVTPFAKGGRSALAALVSHLHDSDSFTPESRRSVGSSNRLLGTNLAFADRRNVCVTQLTYNSYQSPV